jgi:hypothetical protein
MSFDWRILVFAWLALGIVSSMFVYWDMDRRKKVQGVWALLCIPLSVFGILIYLVVRGKIKENGRKLPPKPEYGKPEYRFKDEPKPAAKAEPKEETAPAKPVPAAKKDTPEPKKPEEPFPEPPAAEKQATWTEEKPVKKTETEGIPRCPKCGAEVSSFDAVCGDCGAKLK